MNRNPCNLWLALWLCAVPIASFAHHSFAMFDAQKIVALKGTVKEFQFTNPHSWVQLLTKNDQGDVEEWSLEALGPSILARMGWRPNTLKPGDEITVYFNPTRNGTHGGYLVKLTLADGRTLGGASDSLAK